MRTHAVHPPTLAGSAPRARSLARHAERVRLGGQLGSSALLCLVGALGLSACTGNIASPNIGSGTVTPYTVPAGATPDSGSRGVGSDSGGRQPDRPSSSTRDAAAVATSPDTGRPTHPDGEDASMPDDIVPEKDAQVSGPPPTRRLGKIISFGDSITVGFKGGYQAEVATRLRAAGYAFDGDIVNDGRSGWAMVKCVTSSGTKEGIYQILEPELAKHQPDTVMLMIGTNDVGGWNATNVSLASIGHPEIDCGYESAPRRLNVLIEKIHEERPAAMIFVANIIPIMNGSGSLAESEKYAPKVAALIKQRIANGDKLVQALDVFTGYPRATGYVDDKVHPNEEGQRFIGGRFYEAIQRWLEGR